MKKGIQDYINQKALESNLPFEIEVKPDPENWEGQPTEKIGAYSIPVFNELLQREQWFFEVLATTASNRALELQLEIASLARLIKKTFELESAAIARQIMQEMMNGTTENPAHQNFVDEHQEQFVNLFQMLQTSGSTLVLNLFKVTFFMRSRVREDWDLQHTSTLFNSQFQKISELIDREVNKGVVPQPEPETEEDLGKQSSASEPTALPEAQTGENSSTRSTVVVTETSDSATKDLVTSPVG